MAEIFLFIISSISWVVSSMASSFSQRSPCSSSSSSPSSSLVIGGRDTEVDGLSYGKPGGVEVSKAGPSEVFKSREVIFTLLTHVVDVEDILPGTVFVVPVVVKVFVCGTKVGALVATDKAVVLGIVG